MWVHMYFFLKMILLELQVHLEILQHGEIFFKQSMFRGLTVGCLAQADLLIIIGLHVESPKQRSTSLCPQSLFCLLTLTKTQVCHLLMFL